MAEFLMVNGYVCLLVPLLKVKIEFVYMSYEQVSNMHKKSLQLIELMKKHDHNNEY